MKALATVSLDLPIRIQVADDHAFAVHLTDGPCELRFTEKPAPARADGMRAEGFDDDKGTYVRSTVTAKFDIDIAEDLPLSRQASDRLQGEMRRRAWEYLETFLRTYSHVSHHLESRIITRPESYELRLIDADTSKAVDGFPLVSGHVLPGPLAPKATLTDASVAQIHGLLRSGSTIPLADEILLRAETELVLLHDFDHAILDVATALEVFIDQIIEQEMHYAPSRRMVNQLRRQGIYTRYDKLLRVLGRPSLKDAHPPIPFDDVPLAFELLEFIVVVRNNTVHRGIREFTLKALKPPGYVSPYLDRHEKHDGLILERREDMLGIIKGAKEIIDWIRTAGAPKR